MKIRSAVPENGCLIFGGRKKQKKTKNKTKKTSVKHIRYRLIGGCVNEILAPSFVVLCLCVMMMMIRDKV